LVTPLQVVEIKHHEEWCQLSQNLHAAERQTCANLDRAGLAQTFV